MSAAGEQRYRTDIQGLRAVAALLVAVYHIWLGRVSGGVDVFFVVSGFLITRSLVATLERNGRIDFVAFWSGLARRLLPAALFVLGVIVLGGMLWLPHVHWERTIKEVLASAVYLENWYLNYKQVDYLERDAFVSPVQHFWAMSLQGQIYLTWPLLLAGTAMMARQTGVRLRWAVGGLIAVVFVASLGYSVVTTAIRQPFAYFDTLARVWEFSLGGAVALLPATWSMPRAARLAAGWIGLLAVLLCGIVLPVSRIFPGYAALWPTVAAALILLSGRTGSAFGADRLLSARPLASLGDVSYSIYLWHWPLLVFYKAMSGATQASLPAGLALIVAAVLLAIATTRFLEEPLRFSRAAAMRPAAVIVSGAVGVVGIVAMAGAWGLVYAQAQHRDQGEVVPGDADYPGAAVLDEGFEYAGRPRVRPRPGPLAVRNDLPHAYSDGCQASERRDELLSCVYGDPRSSLTIAVVGGSHSTHWLPALRLIAEKRHWRIVTYLKDMCRLGTSAARTNVGDPYPSCDRWRAVLMRRLLEDPPAFIFTTATYAGEGAERVPRDFVPVWRQLTAAGIRIVAVRDTPYPRFQVAECVEMRGADHPACARPRHQMLAASNPAEQIRDLPHNVSLLDLGRYFCPSSTCPPVIGNIVVYRDDNHITRTYMRTLAPALERELKSVITP